MFSFSPFPIVLIILVYIDCLRQHQSGKEIIIDFRLKLNTFNKWISFFYLNKIYK